jgi:hypothetical protein
MPQVASQLTFQPEGHEDLAIFRETGELKEAIQVKAYKKNLAISAFSPEKPTSFLRRSVELSRAHPQAIVKIASFGPIGPEMTRAWEVDGNERRAITQKLLDHGFSPVDIDTLFHSVQLVRVDESSLRNGVFTFLRESLVGGDPEHAFDLLNYWLYRASENQEKITCDSLIAKINSVGRYLAERATYHQEWFTSIVPIEDSPILENEREALAEEFYQGVAARYEHILAAVDVVRDNRLQEIEAAFRETRVVIIHGASGQGKNTLAYRYLHDFVPEQLRLDIRMIEDRQRALRIARALAGYANAFGAPVVIYIDISHRDRDWPDLIRELAQHRNLHLLVTIREEDWRRASVSGADFQFKSLALTFDEAEARQLYPRLASVRTPDRFLSFEDAWGRFGFDGPLLEFVYLVTQNESLRERLRQQIQHLQDAVRTGQLQHNELELLRLVSVASAYEARVDLKMLVERLKLPEPKRTLELFEREYLLRRSPDERFVEGLHPIRSAILVDLLTDPVLSPWATVASNCLPMIVEDDLEVFLLHSFSRRGDDTPRLLEALSLYQPEAWTGLAGVLRALLWLGVREYVTENQDLIHEVFERAGPGWIYMLDFDIANISSTATSWWKNLDIVPAQMKEAIEEFQRQQTTKDAAFVYAKRWLLESSKMPAHPTTLSDWAGVAEASFWTGYLHVDSPIPSWITEDDLEEVIDTLPLNYLGDVILGLSFVWGDRFYTWLDENRVRILNRFRQKTQTVVLADDGEIIRAHFIVNFERFTEDDKDDQSAPSICRNSLHDEALRQAGLLRKFVPDRQQYGCQGYGHKLGMLDLPFDDTEKIGIPIELLPPHWAVRINSLFCQLGVFPFRPETWLEYAQAVYQLRKMVLGSLQDLQRALLVHFRKQKRVKLLGGYIDITHWDQCRLKTSSPPLLPKCAVDEWGFVGEGKLRKSNGEQPNISKSERRELGTRKPAEWIEIAFSLYQYRDYLAVLRDFTTSLSNFYRQSVHVLALNTVLGKIKSAEGREAVRQTAIEQGIKTDLDYLSTLNFAEAFKALPCFQEEFGQHFSQFFGARDLGRLEKRERNVFARTWSLWYQFAFHPGRTWPNADQAAFGKLSNTLAQVRRDIRRHFRKLSKEGIQAIILSEDVRWESQPALWIALDIPNPADLYTAFEAVMNALRAAMGTIENNGLKRYALDFWWPTIVIVPLIKGKSLTKTAWRIATSVFLSESVFKGNDWWNYMPYPIPSEGWQRLGLTVWEHPRLELANQFQVAVVTLSLLIAHLCDFNRLPEEVDEQGQGILQNYMRDQSSHISEAFQRVLDLTPEMANYFNNLSTEEQEQRLSLVAAVQMLVEMRENIMPNEDVDGELKMNLASMKEWMRRLETARVQAELVRLFWAADVLELSIESEGGD